MRLNLWIFSLVLLLAPTLAPAQHTVLVKAKTLTLREKPSSTGKALNKLSSFQPVELLKTEGEWAQVKTASNQTGYVLATYLTPNAFVFTGDSKINGRYGPGTQYDIIIVYEQPNMPLRVIDATDNGWIMVMDYDGDRSWLYGLNVTTSGRYVITKEPNSNARKGVGIGQDIVFTAQKGVILKVLEEKDGWLHVKHTDGDEGWLSTRIVFGWLDVPVPGSGKSNGAESTDSGKTPASTTKSGSKSGSSDDEDAPSSKSSTKKKGSSSTRRTKSSSSSDDDEEPSAKKSSARSTKSGSKTSGSESSGSSATGSRKTRSRKAPSSSDE